MVNLVKRPFDGWAYGQSVKIKLDDHAGPIVTLPGKEQPDVLTVIGTESRITSPGNKLILVRCRYYIGRKKFEVSVPQEALERVK